MALTLTLADLTDQMQEQNKSTKAIEQNTEDGFFSLEEIRSTGLDAFNIQSQIAFGINALLEFMKGNALAQLEKDRELLNALKNPSTEAPEHAQFTGDGGGGAVGVALGAAALGIGAAAGALLAWGKTIKAYFKLFTTAEFRKSLAAVLDGWKTSIANLKSRMALKVTNIGVALAAFFDDLKMKLTPSAEGPLAKIGARIANFYKIISDGIFESWKGVGTRIGSIFTRIRIIITEIVMKPIRLVRNFFTTIGTHVGKFGSLIGKIAGIAGKVLAPLGIIMVAWDTIMGAIDGFNEGSGVIEGLFLGLKGALNGFVTSLVTVPLDLIKDLVSWVLKKFGFDESSEALDSFSFTDLFLSLTQGIYDFIDGIIDSVVAIFKKGIDIGSNFSIKDFYRDVLRSILPMPNADAPWYDIPNLVSKAIPNSVYEYAGLNPETGDNTVEYDLAQSSEIGAQLAEDQAAKEVASLAKGFAGQAAINSGNTTTVGATTTTVYSHKPSAQGSEAGQPGDIKKKSAR